MRRIACAFCVSILLLCTISGLLMGCSSPTKNTPQTETHSCAEEGHSFTTIYCSYCGTKATNISNLKNKTLTNIAKKLEKANPYPTFEKNETLLASLTLSRLEHTVIEPDVEAYQKALAGLEEAKKTRNVQIFNDKTGRFELVADEKAIQSAQKKVDSAKEALVTDALLYNSACLNLDVCLESETYSDLVTIFENCTVTDKQVVTILERALNVYRRLIGNDETTKKFPEYTGEDPLWVQNIIDIIAEESGGYLYVITD